MLQKSGDASLIKLFIGMRVPFLWVLLVGVLNLPAGILAQNESDEMPLLETSDGVSLGADSLFLG